MNENNVIEIEGVIEGGGKTRFLVDRASQVNACIPKIMSLAPHRQKNFLISTSQPLMEKSL